MTKNPYLQTDRQIVGDIYTSNELIDNLSVLCDEFDSRFAGSEEERKAAQFMKGKLEAYGLQHVTLEAVNYGGWQRGDVKLNIVSPIQKEIPCITLPHSPPVDLEGEIIDLVP